ncbi:MAG: discoidin domain-containing protein, partial [Hamadaea sp.]|nr:discoidin domain-containing protein [Hamadaea sp.]
MPARSRRTFALLASFALVLGLTTAVGLATSAGAAPTLISQGKSVTASSTENAGTPASAAVDGNTGTRWSSAFSDPQWIQIDLGATATLSQVTLTWEAAYATAYQVQVAASGSGPWTTIYSTTTGTGGVQNLTVSGSGRYVRMNGTARATPYGYSLWEFQVYGEFTTPSCGSGNAALNRPATASSTENAGTPASAAVDGNTGTRWSSAFSDPQWLQVDLGSTQTVCQVVLAWEAAYATAYQVQVAASGSGPWTTIYSTTTGTGGTQTLTVNGSGRYIRVNGTARATAYGYSLWEFTVRTTGSTSSPSSSPSPSPTNGSFWGDTSTIP